MPLLSENEIRLLSFNSFLYGYIPWPFPVSWNKNFNSIAFVQPIWKSLPYNLVLLLAAIYALSNCYMFVYFTWISPVSKISLIQKLLLIVVFVFTTALLIILKTLANQNFLDIYNEFMLITANLVRGNKY